MPWCLSHQTWTMTIICRRTKPMAVCSSLLSPTKLQVEEKLASTSSVEVGHWKTLVLKTLRWTSKSIVDCCHDKPMTSISFFGYAYNCVKKVYAVTVLSREKRLFLPLNLLVQIEVGVWDKTPSFKDWWAVIARTLFYGLLLLWCATIVT